MTISIPSKPYVKHFLSINYGTPVDFSKANDLYKNLRSRLKDKNINFKSREIPKWLYSETVIIHITEDDFYRYGWELSTHNIRGFNYDIEARVKLFMRNIVGVYEAVMPLNEAITHFQDRFGFTEDIWPYDSIKKDYYRNKVGENCSIIKLIGQELEKKSLENLSRMGTIAQPLANKFNKSTICKIS